jgi:Family of unknown function (DUF6455)
MMVQVPKRKPDAAGNFLGMAEKLGLATVPAAWPSGMAQLTQAYAACQRCVAEEACADWLTRTPDSIQLPPEFCPNAAEFTRANRKKPRG